MKSVCRILIISSFVIFFYNCKKDNDTTPKVPQSFDCDFNDDKIIDFRIEYSLNTWDGYNQLGNPIGGDCISGGLLPLNENSVLISHSEDWLFRRINDTIYSNGSGLDYYSTSKVVLVSISTTKGTGSVWEKEWNVAYYNSQDIYYLGFKILNKDNSSLGWLKLQINKATGNIEIIDKKTTTNEFIIIGK